MDRLVAKYKIYVNIMDWLDVKKKLKSEFFEIDAQRSNVGVSFLLVFQNMLYVSFYGRVSFACFPKIFSFP